MHQRAILQRLATVEVQGVGSAIRADHRGRQARASRGEEVMITVHGKETAKLVGVPRQRNKIDKKKWLKRLERLRDQSWTGRYGKSAQEIQDEDRADRF
jgi:prevent-host-death family protein